MKNLGKQQVTKEQSFEGMFGFTPAKQQDDCLFFKKQVELVWVVLQSLARAWKSACLEEEALDRKVKDARLVYGNDGPVIFSELIAAKKKVVETRKAFDKAVSLAEDFRCADDGNILSREKSGYYSNTMKNEPDNYLGQEKENPRAVDSGSQ